MASQRSFSCLMSIAPDTAPIELDQAQIDLLTEAFGGLSMDDILLDYANLQQPPYAMAGLGLAISVVCGLTFSRLVQNRLDGWKKDRLPLLPLGNAETVMSYTGDPDWRHLVHRGLTPSFRLCCRCRLSQCTGALNPHRRCTLGST